MRWDSRALPHEVALVLSNYRAGDEFSLVLTSTPIAVIVPIGSGETVANCRIIARQMWRFATSRRVSLAMPSTESRGRFGIRDRPSIAARDRCSGS